MADVQVAVMAANTASTGTGAPAANPLNNSVSAGMVNTTSMTGGLGRPAVLMETNDVSTIQRVIKFTINNLGDASHTPQTVSLRIGSVAARKDAYQNFGLGAGAADDTVITDNVGTGCKGVQGFSEYVCFVPVWTKRIKIFCDDTSQLTESLFYKQLQIDGTTPTQRLIDLAYTQEKSDQRSNMVAAEALYLLDATRYFEYKVEAGVKLTIFIELGAISNSETFTTFPGAN